MTNDKKKKTLYIIGALICAAAFIEVGGFLINFSDGRIFVNVLFSFLAVILACAVSFLGKSAFYKETAKWTKRRWLKEMIAPIFLTIALIIYNKF